MGLGMHIVAYGQVSLSHSKTLLRTAPNLDPLQNIQPKPYVYTMEHICSACQRRRSSAYHDRHPLIPGKAPVPSVCSRCIKNHILPSSAPSSPTTIIHEFHHYHHSCACEGKQTIHEPRGEAPRIEPRGELSTSSELPSESPSSDHPERRLERSPPPIYTRSGHPTAVARMY